LLGADVLAQQITTNLSELPTGGITTLIGAPFLIWLARRSNQLGGNATAQSISTAKKPRLSLNQTWCLVCLLLGIVLVAGLLLGNTTLGFDQLIATLQGDGTALSGTIILNVRLPRVLVAMFAGASLAVSGLLLQSVVRNPLAGPEIIGVSSGAGLGAMLVLTLVPNASPDWIPFAAGLGAIAAFGAVYLLAWRQGISVIRLALMGIAVSAFCSAGINLLVVVAKLRVAQAIVWLTGSTYAQQWKDVRGLILFTIPLLCLARLLARHLDVMALGDEVSRGLGLSLERMRGVASAIAVSLCAIAVSTVGTISFVGLIAPQIARVLVGYRHRALVPMTALSGAILVASADMVGRIAIAPKEIPAGLMTALIGAPYFIGLLFAKRT
jgi:iron complex transport system permease protein